MEEAASSVSKGDNFCVDAGQLSAAFEEIKLIHSVIFFILLYKKIHSPIWSFMNKRCRRYGICYNEQEVAGRCLSENNVMMLKHYSKSLKEKWKDYLKV